jgi:hypothetical protein
MNSDTLLLRQINPTFLQSGRVTSQAFRPTPKDESLLSVYDGDLITAERAWEHFSNIPGCRSTGVLAVTVTECAAQQLSARPDPATFPEHAVIDFSGRSKTEVERKAKFLRSAAEARGWQYRAEP